GGTVRADGAALVPTRGGRLHNGVVFHGDLDLSQTPNAQLLVRDGLTLNGTLWLGDDEGTTAATLEVTNTQTVSTQTGGYMVFGGSVDNRVNVTGAARLTLGAGIVVRGNRGTLAAGGGSFENRGTIQADVAGGTLTVSGTRWTNLGTIQALNGGQLIAQGTTTNYAGGTLTGGTRALFPRSPLPGVRADTPPTAATTPPGA